VRKFHNDKSFLNTDYNAGAYNDEATLKGTTGGRGSFNPGTGGGTGAAFNSGDLSAQLNRVSYKTIFNNLITHLDTLT